MPVEIVVNGKVAGRQNIAADGKLHELKFEVPVKESSWIAARVLPSAHTNPVFAMVGGKPVRASRGQRGVVLERRESVLDPEVAAHAAGELAEAKQAYDHAREVYRRLIRESASQ